MPHPLSSDVLHGGHEETHAPMRVQMKNCWQSSHWIPKVPAAIWHWVRGSWLFKGSQTLTSTYFKTSCLDYIFLLTVIIYFALLFLDVLLVLISRDVIKTSGYGVCVKSSSQAAQMKQTRRGSSCSLNAKLKSTFFQHLPPFPTLIAVQLKLQQFKYFWEYIELMRDAIRQHFAEASRHKISLSR